MAAVGSGFTVEMQMLPADGPMLMIAGGPCEFYVAYFEREGGPAYQAWREAAAGDLVEVFLGGQPTSLPPEFLVPKALAESIALHFAQTQQRSDQTPWFAL